MMSLGAIRLRTAARNAARNHDWARACDAYRAYLDRRPDDAKAWVQYGHVVKDAGDLEAAIGAYGRALDIEPLAAEIWWHLSYCCKSLGDRAGAINCCVRAAALNPDFTEATENLIAWGARDRISSAATGIAPSIGAIGGVPIPESTVYAPSRYDAFRKQLAIAPPPGDASIARTLMILIDAGTALPVEVRATLSSLLDQVDGAWEAIVLAPAVIREHPVASLAAIDPRVRFASVDDPLPHAADAPRILLLGAGTMLDRQAVAWFAFATARTGCVGAYSDHDRSVDDWRTGRRFMDPVFQPMFDPDWLPEPGDGPAAVFVDRTRMPLTGWRCGDAWSVVREAATIGPVAHLPLLLASRLKLAAQAEQAPPDPPGRFASHPPAALAREAAPPEAASVQRIQVVIQTRDEPAMLKAAVDSIRMQAVRADLLDVMIVDNRSVESATARLLDGWQRQGKATVLTLDEPFNWSRANNLAVEAGTAPLLLFLNNDTQMLTADWDDALRHMLAHSDTGAVGATLLYPDRTIQHAGIVMGMGSGGPIHEGVGRSIAEGPSDRWRKPRSAAAVTGAFLAMRRDVFAAVGGFDAVRFAIAFNDIDLCLRVRAAGFRIVMASDILLIHHESKTRGMNVTRSQVAWDLDELGRLHDRWGSAVFADPAYNPHWTRIGHPFDGYRVPSMREIVRHIDESARPAPWAPVTMRDERAWW